SRVLLNDARAPAAIAAWLRSFGTDDNIYGASLRYCQQAKPQPPAKLAHPGIAFAAASPRGFYGQPDLVANIRPVNTLQDEIEIKGKLHFPNYDDGRRALRNAHEIATANLALHMEAEAF